MTQNRYYSSTAKQATVTDNPLLIGATSLNVSAKTGFPATTPYTLILARDTANEEVVTVTAESGLTLTVTRAEDGTTAVQHAQGTTVEHGISARDLDEPQAHIADGQIHNSRGPLFSGAVDPMLCDSSVLMANNEIHYYKYRAQESKTIDGAGFYATVIGAASSAIELALYADSNGPATKLASGSSTSLASSISATGWWAITFNASVDIVQGHDYWIAIRCVAGSGAATVLAKTVTAGAVATMSAASDYRMRQGSAASLTDNPTTSAWTGTKVVAISLDESSRSVP